MRARIRKIITFVEETHTEMGRPVKPVTRRAAAAAVIENPFAGKYVEDLTELTEIGEELGSLLTERAVAALGIPGPAVESYGKAAAIGENGELEHAAAILHPKLGTPVRKVLGGRGADSLLEETRRAGCVFGHSAGTQGRSFRSKPFRWNGNSRERCATSQRDSSCHCGYG